MVNLRAMKPNTLNWPYTWESRRPHLGNRALFVPEYFDRHEEEWEKVPFNHPDYFGNEKEVFIEFCSGNGAWITDKARNNPDVNWMAVEYDFGRARKIWANIERYTLENLLVVTGEALTFSRYYLPSGSISGIYVNFPDPWPKKKHAKNRLFQPPFVEELSRIVKRGGTATLVTDDPDYANQMSSEMRAHSAWRPVFAEPYFVTTWPGGYGASYFDALWRQKGKTIHYFQFENQR